MLWSMMQWQFVKHSDTVHAAHCACRSIHGDYTYSGVLLLLAFCCASHPLHIWLALELPFMRYRKLTYVCCTIVNCTQVGSAVSGRPGSSGNSETGKASAGSTAASGSTSGSSTSMFDVGSRGGFYTEKAPRLMLHEWCTQQKRPKPKYKAVPVEPEKGGGYR